MSLRCINLGSGDELTIDNFAVFTNPNLSSVTVWWDFNAQPLGPYIPARASKQGRNVGLYQGLQRMTYTKVNDEVNDDISFIWSNQVGAAIPTTSTNGGCNSKIGGVSSSDPEIVTVQLFMMDDWYKVVTTFDSPLWSLAGEVGGAMDLIIYAVTFIIFLWWACYARVIRRNEKLRRLDTRSPTRESSGGEWRTRDQGGLEMREVKDVEVAVLSHTV